MSVKWGLMVVSMQIARTSALICLNKEKSYGATDQSINASGECGGGVSGFIARIK